MKILLSTDIMERKCLHIEDRLTPEDKGLFLEVDIIGTNILDKCLK